MLPSALLSAPLLVALVLLISSVGKFRSPEDAVAAFEAMGLPRALRQRWVVRTHPIAEVLLAVALVTTWGGLGRLATLVTLALFLIYLALIWGASRRDEPVDCACFGGHVASTVTGATVWRNAWLVFLTLVALLVSGRNESAIAGLFRSTDDALWVLAILATGLTALLIVGPLVPSSHSPATFATRGAEDIDEAGDTEYRRIPTPHVPVTLANGTSVPLTHIAVQRAQLLVAVSKGCSACGDTLAKIPQWRSMLPLVDVRPVYFGHEPPGDDTWSLWDPQAYVQTSLRLFQTPSAVLLGVDGMLAGGPEYGLSAIHDLIAAMQSELEDASTAQLLVAEESQ